MADYKPLLTRALGALPASTAESRQAVYQRARDALGRQFANPEAAIPAEVAARELASLEAAIEALEAEQVAAAAVPPATPDNEAATAQATVPDAPEPQVPAPVQVAVPAPPLPPPPKIPLPPPAPGMPAPPVAPQLPRKAAPDTVEPVVTPPEPPAAQPVSAPQTPVTPARPKAPNRDHPQGTSTRKLAVLAVGVLVVAAVGTFAWLRRNEPPAVASGPPVVASRPETARPPPGKVDERVGTDSGPARPAPGPTVSPPAQPPVTAAPPQPAPVAIANRLIFIEEGRDNPQNVAVRQGSAVWRIDSVSGGQGQPLETVIRTDLDIPEARLRAEMTMRRNRDRAFPASHTIELRFTAQPGNEIGPIAQLNVVEARQVENQPGFPMVGQGITVMENVFLIALSAADQLAERNIEMLRQRPWIYMEAQLVSGRRIAMVFEKGVSGQQVFEDALRTW